MQFFYSPDYNATSESFDTLSKADAIARSLKDSPIPGVTVVAPRPASPNLIKVAHSRRYLKALGKGSPRKLAESNGLEWDHNLLNAAAASSGGMVTATLTALEQGCAGTASSGLHHARRGGGNGFCTLNGLAMAAAVARATDGIKNVLVLDLDAHCGGGTASIIADWDGIEQVDVSVSTFDHYRSTPWARLSLVKHAKNYLPTIERVLTDTPAANFDVVLYNAGMDPHSYAGGNVDGIDTAMLAERERMVFDWVGYTPIAFCMAGGYTSHRFPMDSVVNLHRLTIAEAARHSLDD